MRKWILFLIILFFTIFLATPMQLALTISDGKSMDPILVKRMETHQRFAIQFIHSIHRTPVYEEYYIDDQQNIVLDQVMYESYGVGNPSTLEPGQTYKHENGKYIIGHMNRKMPYFDQVIGQVIANHQLHLKGKWIPLASLNPPGSWVRIQARKVSMLTWWLYSK